MKHEDVKWLHVEASSKCNAWCPMCPRNNDGYEIYPGMIEEDLSIDVLEKTLQALPNLEVIQFCGNHGDPCIAKNFLDMIDLAKKHVKKIQIHTNGGMRNEEWWRLLASKLTDIDHDVWFGIDGLKGIHELYRQGTNWDKVIKNAQAFIDNGGYATWQFLLFKHNEHQLNDCMDLSQKLNFKDFKLMPNFRNPREGKNYVTGETYIALESTAPSSTQTSIPLIKKTKIEEKNCMHLGLSSIYLDAHGNYSYCCYYLPNPVSKKTKFDSLENLFYNSVDTSSKLCIAMCNSVIL